MPYEDVCIHLMFDCYKAFAHDNIQTVFSQQI